MPAIRGLGTVCMSDLVLFGVGAALIVDYEESCKRLGVTIVAAIQNRDGEVFFSDPARLRSTRDFTPAILATPCLCPIFSSEARRIAQGEAAALGFKTAATLIDPAATVASSTRIGPGGYINAGAIIAAASSIGDHVVINRGATVGHHVVIADFVSIGPSAAILGHARIGASATIGASAIILPRLRIGENATVGAGAVVTRDVPVNARVLGNPARIVEEPPPRVPWKRGPE